MHNWKGPISFAVIALCVGMCCDAAALDPAYMIIECVQLIRRFIHCVGVDLACSYLTVRTARVARLVFIC